MKLSDLVFTCPNCRSDMTLVDTDITKDVQHLYCDICGKTASAKNFEKAEHIHVKSGHLCPLCRSDMVLDLILHGGGGVNSQQLEIANVAGYGYFCFKCQHGWTSNQLAVQFP